MSKRQATSSTKNYLERRLDDECSYSRQRREHSETSSRVYVFSLVYCCQEFRFHYPSLCRFYPSLWHPREASPPTFVPCWRNQVHRSRPIWSSDVAKSPTSLLLFVRRFFYYYTILRQFPIFQQKKKKTVFSRYDYE